MPSETHLASTKYAVDWKLHSSDGGHSWPKDTIQIILLQEIRDELKKLNTLLHCHNFVNIAKEMRDIGKLARAIQVDRRSRRKVKK